MTTLLRDTFTRADTTTNTNIATGWGTASDGNTWSQAGTTNNYKITSNEGTVTNGTGVAWQLLGTTTAANADARVRASVTNTGDDICIILCYADTNNHYRFRVKNATNADIVRVSGGTVTQEATATITRAASTFYFYRARVENGQLFFKFWDASTTEPAAWTVTWTDPAPLAAGKMGLLTDLSVSTHTVSYDSFLVTDISTKSAVVRTLVRTQVTQSTGLRIVAGTSRTRSTGLRTRVVSRRTRTIGLRVNVSGAGTNATWEWDTDNRLLAARDGRNAVYLLSANTAVDSGGDLITSRSDDGGVLVRYTNVANHYRIIMHDDLSASSPQTITISKRVGGANTQLDQKSISFRRGTYHALKWSIIGSVITVSWDGILISTVSDSSITTCINSVALFNGSGTAWYHTFRSQQYGQTLTASTGITTPRRWLSLSGGKVVDSMGKRMYLRGLNTAGLEFGDGIADYTQARINAFATPFSMNLWRLAINVAWWNNNALLTDGVTHYQDWIQQLIGWMKSAGCYVEIDPTTYVTIPPTSSGSYCGVYSNIPQSSVASDTFIHANQSGWPTSSGGAAWVTLSGSATQSIASNEGVITAGEARYQLGSGTATDQTASVRFALTETTDARTGILFRISSSSTYYLAYAMNGLLVLNKNVAGVDTNVVINTRTYTSGTFYQMRVYAVGTTIYVRTWTDGTPEPNTWEIQVTDSSIASGGYGLYGKAGTGDQVQLDHFNVGTPVTACIPQQDTLNFPPWTDAQIISATNSFYDSFIPLYASDPAILYDALNEPRYVPYVADPVAASNAVITHIQSLQPNALIFVYGDSTDFNSPPDIYPGSNLVWDYHLYDDPAWHWQSKLTYWQPFWDYAHAHNHAVTIGEWNAGITNDPNGFGAAIANLAIAQGIANTYYNADNLLQSDNTTLTAQGLIVAATFQTIAAAQNAIATRVRMSTNDASVSPQLIDLTLSLRSKDIGQGAWINQTSYQYQSTVAAAADDLAKRSSGYWWDIKSKKLTFQARGAVYAPWPLGSIELDLQANPPPKVTYASPLYRNRQFITGAFDTATTQESKRGDTKSQSWNLSFPVFSQPTILLNGVVQSVGVGGIDTGKAFYWSFRSIVLSQDKSLPILQDGDVLSITYVGLVPYVAQKDSLDQQALIASYDGASGIIEAVESCNGLLKDAADQLAQARLDQYAVLALNWNFTTLRPGLAAGHWLFVFVPEYDLNNVVFQVTEVNAQVYQQSDGSPLVYYAVSCTTGPIIGPWSKLFIPI